MCASHRYRDRIYKTNENIHYKSCHCYKQVKNHEKLGVAISIISPILKSDTTNLSNYIPIATLSSFNKILEIIIFNQITSFFDNYSIDYNYQFGLKNTLLNRQFWNSQIHYDFHTEIARGVFFAF